MFFHLIRITKQLFIFKIIIFHILTFVFNSFQFATLIECIGWYDFITFQISCRNIFVTTLDGTLSALDIEEGSLSWSVSTEPGELLSSSIHRLELTTNGKQVRMIPSLSGKNKRIIENYGLK